MKRWARGERERYKKKDFVMIRSDGDSVSEEPVGRPKRRNNRFERDFGNGTLAHRASGLNQKLLSDDAPARRPTR